MAMKSRQTAKTAVSAVQPATPTTVPVIEVTALAHDGRGIGHAAGKAVFIEGALPKETVRCRYTQRHSQHDEAIAETILNPSPQRVTPLCRHVALCGGCSLQHLHIDAQITYKQKWLLDNLARIGKVQPQHLLPPLVGPAWGYRRRARLSVKAVAKKGRVLVGFRERRTSYVADLQRCEILHPPVGERLEALSHLIANLSIYNRIPQIEVAAGDDTVALSIRVLTAPTPADCQMLCAFAEQNNLLIYLQSQGLDSTTRLWPPAPAAPLCYRLSDHHIEILFQPFHFIQVNAAINRAMVNQALTLLALESSDQVLDLFCGLGNFTLPIARYAKAVVGIEGDSALVACAQKNALHNQLTNINFIQADLSRPLAIPDWQHRYDKVLLDPPRVGAAALIPSFVASQARRIVYVSCHPATLARDAAQLVQAGYQLTHAGVMDMFPHTLHVESMALFQR